MMKKISMLALCAAMLAAAPASTRAHGNDKHVQKPMQNVIVTVDGSGYHPSSVQARAGQPVHLTFVSKGESCANGISIPALKKSFSLKVGQKKSVVFTLKKGQTIGFACSMKMFKGKVVAK